ncbi:G protein-coupled glucose receptor regulating Gpa2-domain-containing protein [Chaetomium strumarium]|uniref:G protein-coupled glucose receptor regulating Gpa2-domain-containing protein n=1 Tax=Chaetomium strumarium TaxID=1170767 RepID=A0AAJ0GV63_9PEZI|nr:G protein-coupled glucose receptor regulating Gpa2-domain-containing protein [Chaetomium strumarium]
MTSPRWSSPTMPLLQRSGGGATSGMSGLMVAARHVGNVDSTQPTVRVLLILSLTFALISVLSTLSALYLFVKMRRRFRHELILLLIQSDFLKSFVFVVFPIISFASGGIQSDSALCQISGFTLAVGIESSDVAVLLIALHSVMCIFRPRSGLYAYRQVAYSIFYLFPLVAGSLAFVNGNGYENLSHYCYLRTDRIWTRMALSWVPRYIICASIVVIYLFIYLYIRRRMGDYERRRSEAMQQQPQRPYISAPPTPRLCCHGLIPSTPTSRRTSAVDPVPAEKDRKRSASSAASGRTEERRTRGEAHQPTEPVEWNWTGFKEARSSGTTSPTLDDTTDPVSPHMPPLVSPAASDSRRPNQVPITDGPSEPHPAKTRVPFPPQPQQQGNRLSCSNNNNTNNDILEFLPQPSLALLPPRVVSISKHCSPAASDTIVDETDLSPILPTFPTLCAADSANTKQREKTVRQLRALFAYPLVYIIVWLFPFVSHVLRYDDDGDGDGPAPFWLLVLGIISLCVQGAVDCALFMARETPWRYAQGRGFWLSLRRRWAWCLGGWWCSGDDGGSGSRAGRTREEMLVDGRLARKRREEEMVVERDTVRSRMGDGGRARGREWWEVHEDYGDGGLDRGGGFEGPSGDEDAALHYESR